MTAHMPHGNRLSLVVLTRTDELPTLFCAEPGTQELTADCGHTCMATPPALDLIANGCLTSCVLCVQSDLLMCALGNRWRVAAALPLPAPESCDCPVAPTSVVLIDGDVAMSRALYPRWALRLALVTSRTAGPMRSYMAQSQSEAQRVIGDAIHGDTARDVMHYLSCPRCDWRTTLVHVQRSDKGGAPVGAPP